MQGMSKIGNSYRIPTYVKRSIDKYVKEGAAVGGFLEAILSNDLMATMGAGDDVARNFLREVTWYVFWETPGGCWGSKEKYEAWLEVGGEKGMKQLGILVPNPGAELGVVT